MARVTVEDCLEKVENRFTLVQLAVRRVLQLRKGAVPLVEAPKNKEVVVALREIAAEKVTVDNIRELEGISDALLEPGSSMSPDSSEEVREMIQETTHVGPEAQAEEAASVRDDVAS